MTTLPLDRRTINSVYGGDNDNQLPPKIYTEPRPTQDASDSRQSLESEVEELAIHHLAGLRNTDPDERLDYINYANPALTEDHLCQIVQVTDEWLTGESRDRMRSIARQFVTNQRDPRGILLDWLTDEGLVKLQSRLADLEFPDPILATCYALCEADGVGHAAYFIHQDRIHPQMDLANIEQSQEEIDDDLRFVDAK